MNPERIELIDTKNDAMITFMLAVVATRLMYSGLYYAGDMLDVVNTVVGSFGEIDWNAVGLGVLPTVVLLSSVLAIQAYKYR